MSNLDAIRALGAEEVPAPSPHSSEQISAQQTDPKRPDFYGFDDVVKTQSEPETKVKGGRHDRAELLDMCAEVSLMELVREDTNEIGKQSGDYVAFKKCPACGHEDCFRVYPNTNTWACYGGSNENAREGKKAAGGTVLDYMEQVRHLTKTEAVKWLREVTGNPFEPVHDDNATEEQAEEGDALKLPPWDSVRAADPPNRNPILIHGILRRGHVGLIVGKGKGSKTWSAIECAVAVATGGSWFGFRCESGKVLYIDPELDHKSLDARFSKVCEALRVDPAEIDSRVSKWCLRGVPDASMTNLIHDLKCRGEAARFDLVIIDSASCFVEGDENSSVDLRRFAAYVLRIAAITGAAVLLVHHMGKGDAGDRDSIERARGSSVWGDFPDAPLSLTEIFPKEGKPSDYLSDGERAFILEDSGLREFPSIKPTRLIFSYPVHRIDSKSVTADWSPRTSASRRRGGKQTAELNKAKKRAEQACIVSGLLGWFYSEGIGEEGASLKECAEHVGLDSRKVRAAVEESTHLRVYKQSPRKCFVVPAHPPKAEEHTPTLFEDGSDY